LIVGEWQSGGDGGTTESFFFNANGTCGSMYPDPEYYGGCTPSICNICSTCTYTYGDGALSVTDDSVVMTTTYEIAISGDTMIMSTPDETFDGGASVQLARVNASATNVCP
jgi:hypothetical protein